MGCFIHSTPPQGEDGMMQTDFISLKNHWFIAESIKLQVIFSVRKSTDQVLCK